MSPYTPGLQPSSRDIQYNSKVMAQAKRFTRRHKPVGSHGQSSPRYHTHFEPSFIELNGILSTRCDPLYFKKVGCKGTGIPDFSTDRGRTFSVPLELLNPKIWSHKFQVIYPSVS